MLFVQTVANLKQTWLRPKVIVWGVFLLLLITVILQNVEPTSVDLLFWSLPQVPKIILILIAMAIGALITALGLWQRKRRSSFIPGGRSTLTPE